MSRSNVSLCLYCLSTLAGRWRFSVLLMLIASLAPVARPQDVVVLAEDDLAFITIPGGPSVIEYDITVLEGPSINIFLLTEDNFMLYQRNSWSWKYIDLGSKLATRQANAYVDIPSAYTESNATLYLVLDNTATMLVSDETPQWNAQSLPATVEVRVATIGNHAEVHGIRTVPLARWTLLLFLAILPAYPLLRHYVFMLYPHSQRTTVPLVLILSMVGCGALMALPLRPVEQGLHSALSMLFHHQDGLILSLLDAFFVAAVVEELCKWTLIVLFERFLRTERLVVLGGIAVSLGFAVGENVYYGFHSEFTNHSGFGTLFLRALTAFPSHTVSGAVMGYHFALGRYFWSFILPLVAHGIYDLPILLSERGMFDRDVLTVLIVVLLYLEDGYAHGLVQSIADARRR